MALISKSQPNYEDKTSTLVEQGLKALQDFEKEVNIMREVEQEKAIHTARTRTAMERIRRELRPNADFRKIKQFVDPKDHATSRVIVSEFQKYVEDKAIGRPAELYGTISRKVQFDKEKNEQDRNAGLGYDDPTPKMTWTPLRQDYSTNNNNYYRSNNAITRGLSSRGVMGTRSRKGPDPEFWRRKILDGFMQTEVLMSELARQRQDDENYFNTNTATKTSPNMTKPVSIPYPLKFLDQYPTSPSARLRPRGQVAVEERERLTESLESSRRIHENCFGSCPQPKTFQMMPPKVLPVMMLSPKPSNYDQDDATMTRQQLEMYGQPATARKKSTTPKIKEKSLTKTTTKPSTTTKTFQKDKIIINQDDGFEVIFARSVSTLPASEVQKRMTKSKMGHAIQTTPEKKVEETTESKKPVLVVDNTKSQRSRSEWVSRLAEAKKAHETKDHAIIRARIEKQKAQANDLYNELALNKLRLENEVNLERRKLALAWKFGVPGRDKERQKSAPSSASGSGRRRSGGPRKLPPGPLRPQTAPGKGRMGTGSKDRPRPPSTRNGEGGTHQLNNWLSGVMERAQETRAKEETLQSYRAKKEKERRHRDFMKIKNNLDF